MRNPDSGSKMELALILRVFCQKRHRRDPGGAVLELCGILTPIWSDKMSNGEGSVITKDVLTELYNVKRLSIDQIAEQLQTTRWTVRKQMSIHGIAVRFHSVYHLLTEEVLRDLYNVQMLSTEEIARRLNVSVCSVIRYMDQYRIARRGVKEATLLAQRKMRDLGRKGTGRYLHEGVKG